MTSVVLVVPDLVISFIKRVKRWGGAGLSIFRELLSDAWRELARLSLQHPSLGLSKTASLLGYEDPNSFLRAFRMWEGIIPSDWRAMQKAGRSKRPPD